ncbi:MAG: divergent PAP2 family protein [Treponema sp.]|jgi:acid phosphatase family membrane protein YuiD|nr:divergent PAP2 family protein [Treponema sp.]
MRTSSLKAFFENPIFLASVTSWFFAQLIKAVIVLLSPHKKGVYDVFAALVWRTGGMPSSHAALVAAMTTSVAFTEGVGSNLFIMSFWLALIVMRDAMGVRRSSGLQSRSLNALGKAIAEKLNVEFKPVKEIHGHKPLEVAVGALLGVFIAAAYAFL